MKQEPRYWLDSSANVTLLFRSLWGIGILLLLLDLWIHRHEQWSFAEVFGFHGFYGFVACVGLVLTARCLRILLKRPENYYDR